MLAALAPGFLPAQEVTIRNVGRGHATGWAFVDNGWVRDTELVEVKFNVKSALPSSALKMEWGFFDLKKKLLGKFRGLPKVQTRGGAYQSLPESLEPGRTYEASFPVPPSLDQGANRWRTFLLELGPPPTPARAIYPPLAGQAEDLGLTKDGPPTSVATDIRPVIKRLSRYRNGLSAWVNKRWVNGLNTLRVTVQVDAGAAANDFYARVYFFDAAKKLVFAWQNPPQVAVRTGGAYVSLPGFWKDGQSYDLHFPIPAEYDRGAGQWRTAIVLFGNTKAIVAESYPAAGQVAEFDFPEKGRLPKK